VNTPLPLDQGRLTGPSFFDDPRVQTMFRIFDGHGEETRIVGGAVRNAILGVEVNEIDFATTATPDEVTRRATGAGLRCVPTGIEHGTVTVLVEGMPFEVTTLREDVETDGRRARVRFGRDFQHDAMRRDFTINALSLGADRRVFDYTGGLHDIALRRVCFIGEPRQRIREDYLRILRFFRFHAAYGEGAMDAAAFHAIILERDGLLILSRERVRAELMKLLVTDRAPEVVTAICDTGLLLPVLAGIAYPARLTRLATLEAMRGDAPDAELRWTALFDMVREDADRLRERLRLSNAEADRATQACRVRSTWHGHPAPPDVSVLREMLFLHGQRAARDGLRLAHVDSGAELDDESWRRADLFLRDTPEPRLPFKGADLVARGIPAGQAVGRTLKLLQAKWIRAGFPKEPAVLARLLEDAMREAG
jgi:poly(A) polymerase